MEFTQLMIWRPEPRRVQCAMHHTGCMARPVRLERTTCGFEVRRSIQLSYGRFGVSEGTRTLDHWGHNPVLYPTELHSPWIFSCKVPQITQFQNPIRYTLTSA